MKLYEVDVTVNLLVWANSRAEAEQVAPQYADEEMFNAECTAMEVVNFEVPNGWEDSVPYGDAPPEYDCMSISEIKERIRQEQEQKAIDEYVDPNQLSLF